MAWTDARFPTIRDPSLLRSLVRSLGLSCTRLLSDDSPPTLLERSGGNWEDVMAGLGAGPGGPVAEMAAAFRAHVSPSAAAASTRSKDWAGWRAVLSWATARRALGNILPMHRQTLDALLWELLACRCTTPIIKGVIDAVQARHRRFALTSPIAGPRAYSRLVHSLTRFQGTQSPYKSPIVPALVRSILLARTTTPAEERNALAATLATVCGLRPSEGACLQACDLRLNFDLRHGRQYTGTAAPLRSTSCPASRTRTARATTHAWAAAPAPRLTSSLASEPSWPTAAPPPASAAPRRHGRTLAALCARRCSQSSFPAAPRAPPPPLRPPSRT